MPVYVSWYQKVDTSMRNKLLFKIKAVNFVPSFLKKIKTNKN